MPYIYVKELSVIVVFLFELAVFFTEFNLFIKATFGFFKDNFSTLLTDPKVILFKFYRKIIKEFYKLSYFELHFNCWRQSIYILNLFEVFCIKFKADENLSSSEDYLNRTYFSGSGSQSLSYKIENICLIIVSGVNVADIFGELLVKS